MYRPYLLSIVYLFAFCYGGLARAGSSADAEALVVDTQEKVQRYWTPDPAYTSGPMNYDCSRSQAQLREYRSVTLHKRFLIDANGRVKNFEVLESSHPDYDWRCGRSMAVMIRYLPTANNPQRRPVQFDGEIKEWIPD